MSKKVRINICKSITFLFIVCFVFYKVLIILNYKDMGGGGGWQRFYELPEKTIDVAFFGSSHAHCTIDHGILWKEYGIAGYTISAASQNIDSTYYFIKEALRVQKPKLLVVEVWGAILPGYGNNNESVYRNSLGMKWSPNLVDFVNHLSNDMGGSSRYRNHILTKFPIVHSRYTELSKDDFVDEIPYMMGYRGSFERAEFDKPIEIDEEKVLPLSEECEEYVYKIINLAKEYKTELLFIASPYVLSDEDQMLLNRVSEIAKEEHIPMINYNHLYEKIDIDYKKDFRDAAHVNNYGAHKVTSHLGEYIKENYDIQDRRGQNGYEKWDLNSRYLDGKWQTKKLRDAQEVNSYLKELSNITDKTIILSLTGNHTAAGDVYVEGLTSLNIDYKDYINGGTWIFEDGELVKYLNGKEYSYCYKVKDSEIHVESKIREADGDMEQKAEIIFKGNNYSFVVNGINVLVYDKETKQIIDNAGVDIYIRFDVVRDELTEN